jgi:hypothetical protein
MALIWHHFGTSASLSGSLWHISSSSAGYGATVPIPEFIGFKPRVSLRDYDIVSWDPKRACGLVATAFS